MLFLKPNYGMSLARKNTAPPKSYFYPQPITRKEFTRRGGQSSDSFYLQFALAHRASVFFAGLFDENGPPRRLPQKIRSAPGNLRPRAACAAVPEWREKDKNAARRA